MKALVLAAPFVVLAVGLAWLGSLRGTTGALAASNDALRERIRLAAPERIGHDGTPNGTVPFSREAPLTLRDLREIAPELSAEESGGIPDLRLMFRFQSRILTMGVPEILAMLGEIAASDIPKAHRKLLEDALHERLADVDPKAYLDHHADRLSGDSQMTHAFDKWMEVDFAAASAWMDRMLADGKFDAKRLDGKDDLRIEFEAGLIHHQLGTDFSAVAKRIAAVPENQRLDLLRHFKFTKLVPGTEKSYADLVRAFLPKEDQIKAFPHLEELAGESDGLEKASGFLAAIEADPSERSQLAARAVSRNLISLADHELLNVEAAHRIHAWIAAETSGGVDALLGAALASAVRSRRLAMMDTSTSTSNGAVELITALHREHGGDELLLAFLEQKVIASYPAESATLVALLQDPDQRNELTERIRDLTDEPDNEE